MRKRFEQQTTLGITPIAEVKVNIKSRDELPPVLVALQYIFTTPALNEKIFSLLETKIVNPKKNTGRPGMDLWHVLVLAIVRHTLNTNWDRMEYLANNDKTLRKIMGVHVEKFGIEELEFCYQTIVDNVSLIDEQMIGAINEMVVSHGQQLFKKKEEALMLQLKSDTFVTECNIHFPTDLNLLYDSLRKGLQTIGQLCKQDESILGWRKYKSIISDLKSLFRKASHSVFKGRSEAQKRQRVKDYLQKASAIHKRLSAVQSTEGSIVTLMALRQYTDYIALFIDQIDRRLLQGEQIAASEKIYSIFEAHTEWITKGKQHKKVELGHLVLITTDQHSFIVDYKVMENEKDVSQISDLTTRLNARYAEAIIESHSFDKGFWSKDNLALLQEQPIDTVVLPKRGNHNKADRERESNPQFKHYRRKHSAVESNINMLEHHGLNRCPDKGFCGYKAYVGMSVLAYNLHQLGNKLIAKQRKEEQRSLRRIDKLLKKAA